jgi:hypothetical protein
MNAPGERRPISWPLPLIGRVEQQKSEIQTLKEKAAKVDSLEKRVGDLERVVRSLAEEK